MNSDKLTSTEAERLQKWREKKKEENRERFNVHYTKHKTKILTTRKKKRLASKTSPVSCSTENENVPSTSSFFTSRQEKKRALDKARKALPQSPRQRVEVLTALLDSPTTHKFVAGSVALNSPEQQEEVKLAKAIIQDVSSVVEETKNKRSDGARTTMHVGLSVLCGSHVAEGNMRKSLAQALNINRRRIALSVKQETTVLCDKDALWALTKRRTRSDAIPDEHKKLAQEFWSSPGISRTTGNKKDVKRERTGPKQYVVHEKQVLEKTQTEVYEEFKEKYPDIRIGQRAFEKCKPFYVIETRPQDRQSCCCRSHVEIRMLLRTCMSFRRSVLKGKLEDERETYPVYEHLSSLVEQTMCNKEDDSYHRLSCVNRECEDCGLKNIKFMLAEEDTSQTAPDVKWERFENVVVGEDKRRLKIVTKITKPGDMFSYFKSLLESFPGHEFRAKWQQEQMHRNIENLPLGEACCVHDYSENYCCRYQEEIQSLYFSQAQVSIHVTILHRHALKHIDGLESTEEQRELITEHLFVISPDIKHDHDSVHECRRYISDYLKEIDYPVKVLHEWTDGCAAQYKSCHCMGDVSYSKLDFGFLTLRNYFETSHAKGPQDGAGSNLKHKADMAVIRRQVVIQNARDLYEYAKENLTEPSSTRYKSQSVGLKRRIFIYVEQHRRNRKNRRFKQIKGSRQIHSIMATDESAGSHLKTRLLSCYCEYCLDGDFGACENSDIVDGWEEIHIETERITRRVTRSQVVGEERNGLKDIVSEGSCVAIASGDPGEDYYLLKVSEGPKELQRLTRDDWGATYPAGAEVLSGHWLLPVTCTRSSRSYKVDYTRMALVYASTARFLCTNLRPLPQDTFEVMEEEHINILQSLEGF